MDTTNCQTTIPKALSNQSVFCPWTSRAPITSSTAFKHGNQKLEEQFNKEQNKSTCQHGILNQPCLNNHQMNTNDCINNVKLPSMPSSCPSVQQSSSQFLHFLRLMQLFPDVHPATLHTVMILCKSDFFSAVDKLLYAKRYKQMCNNRKNMQQACLNTSKCNRHKPYYYMHPTAAAGNYMPNGEGTSQNANANIPSHVLIHGYSQMTPLDVSVKKIQINQNHPSISSDEKTVESIGKMKSNESMRKAVPRNKIKPKDKSLPATPPSSNDLPPVASPQCKLPIRPLSPINGVAEDLSKQSVPVE